MVVNLALENPEEKVPINPFEKPVTELPKEVADERAAKWHFAYGMESPGYQQLQQTLAAGLEDNLRRQLATAKDLEFQKTKNQIVNDMAKSRGGALTEEDVNQVMDLSQAQLGGMAGLAEMGDRVGELAGSIFETTYAKKLVSKVATMVQDSPVFRAFTEDPEATHEVLDVAEDFIAKREGLLGVAQDMEARKGGMSWGSWGADFAETMVPFKSWFNTQNAINPDAEGSPFLPGSNIAEQRDYLWSLSPERAIKEFREAVNKMAETNVNDAAAFANAMVTYGDEDAFIDNLFGVWDLVDVATLGASALGVGALGKVAKGAAKSAAKRVGERGVKESTKEAATAMRDLAKAVRGKSTDITKILAETGDTVEAGRLYAVRMARESVRDVDPTNNIRDIREATAGLFNPKRALEGASDLSTAAKERIYRQLEESGNLLQDVLANQSKVRRLTDEALIKATDEAIDAVKRRYTHINDSILDISYSTGRRDLFGEKELGYKPIDGTYQVSLHLGKPEGSLFDSGKEAYLYANGLYKLPPDTYTIKQQGNGFYIKLDKDVNESLGSVRDQLITPTENTTPKSLVSTWLGFLRTPEDTLSQFQRQNRHLATHGVSEVHRLMSEAAKPIGKLSRKQLKDLGTVLQQDRDFVSKVTRPDGGVEDVRGRNLNSVSELEQVYMQNFKRPPSEKEIAAYFTAVQLNDLDFVMRNMDIRRDKVIQGVESFRIYFGNTADIDQKSMSSKWMDMVEVDDIPWEDADNAGILVMNHETNKIGFRDKNSTSADFRKYVERLMKEGNYKVLQVHNPQDNPLQSFTGVAEEVNFVIVRDFEAKPLPFLQIPYRAGGHVVNTTEFFVKQPKIKVTPSSMRQRGSITLNNGKAARTPDPKPGHTRYYVEEGGTKFSEDYETVKAFGKPVKYVDVPKDELNYWTKGEDGFYTTDKEKAVRNVRQYNETSPEEPAEPMMHQGISDRKLYKGDRTWAGFNSEKEAIEWSNKMDTARKLMVAGDTSFDNYVKTNLPYSPDAFKNLFEPVVDKETGEILEEALFSKNDSFVYTRNGQHVSDKVNLRAQYGEGFEDSINSKYNLFRDIDKKFAGTRDLALQSVVKEGTETNPVFKFQAASTLDPLETLNRTMANISRSKYFDDYKIASAMSWVEEFGDLLVSGEGAGTITGERAKKFLRDNPVLALHEPIFSNKSGDLERIRAAQNARRAILNLIGTPDEVSKTFSWMKQKILNEVYDRMGSKATNYVADHLLPKVEDPLTYMRSIAFHTKLGLFNPVQIFLQAQTMANIMAIAGPKNAGVGSAGYALMRRLALTNKPQVIEHMAEVSTKFGWKKDDFIEAYNTMRRVGVDVVEGEMANLDDVLSPKLYTNSIGKFANKGLVFFRETEKAVRMTAWNAAYLEWRRANPNVPLNDKIIGQILVRQNDLTVNMTRASNAMWNQGFLSIPTQFFAYQIRLAEQFWGDRLTFGEKARLYLMFSTLYGVPTATGAVAGIWPMYEDIKQTAMEMGIPVNDGVMEAFMEGLPSVAMEAIFGEEFNVAQRYGPGGLTFFKEALNGDKTSVEIAMGASGSIFGDILGSIDPVWNGIKGVFSQDNDTYPLLAEDFIDATRNISTVNNAVKMIYAMNTGKYISKNEIYMGDVTTWDAVFMGMTGLSPREVSDAFIKIESLQELRDAQMAAKKEAIKYFRKAFEAKSVEEKEQYLRAAKVHIIGGGFTPDQYSDIFLEATRGNTSLVDKINEDFWRKAPVDQMQPRLDERLRQGN